LAFHRGEWYRSCRRTLVSARARRIPVGPGAVVLAGVAAVASQRALTQRDSAILPDTTRLVLMPLEGAGARKAQWHDDDMLHQALSRWRGLYVVDQFQVADGLRRVGSIESGRKAEELARSLGA